jgi:RNA polymerase sigma-70 factor (ECF subfamily)
VKVADELDEIIHRAQRRDPSAFDALVDRYSSRLYGFLFRFIGRAPDAEDLVQEVFVRLVRTIETYEHDGRFEAWLFRIAANLARDRARRLSRTPVIASLDTASDGDGRGQEYSQPRLLARGAPHDRLETAEDVDRLQVALTRLPPAEREVVMLRHFSELSFAEIAQIMGTPLGTALARAHRGLAKLRQLMESEP